MATATPHLQLRCYVSWPDLLVGIVPKTPSCVGYVAFLLGLRVALYRADLHYIRNRSGSCPSFFT